MSVTLINVLLAPIIYPLLSLANFLLNYGFYFVGFLLLRVIYKLYSEVYNERLKLKPSSNQAILITGATSGIGLALSKYFYRLGYSVIAGYYSKEELGYGELMKLNESGKSDNSIHFVSVDVRSTESIAESYAIVSKLLVNKKLYLHALINNAGTYQYYRSIWNSRKNLQSVVETNLLGPILMVRQYFPLLAKAPNSRIVNVSSCISFVPSPYSGVYGATKSGLAYYTNSLAIDIDGFNVKTVTIYPGNLIRNTSILTSCASDIERVFSELSAEEKELYGGQIEQHKRVLTVTEKSLRSFQEMESKLKSGQIPSSPKRGDGLRQFFRRFHSLVWGSIDCGVEMEDSEFMDSFDNAIRLQDPPKEMFAGNRFYSIFIGALANSLGHSTLNRIGYLAVKYGLSLDRS